MNSKPHAIIVGAGFTGCATAHDLALRGFEVTVVDRGDIASGTSGRTHGLLHSGGRYCVTDIEAGVECIEENILLRKIAKQCIEFNGGLFVALNEEDLAFAPRFTAGAKACHIPIEEIKPGELKKIEPNLNPKILLAYAVPDGAFDPLRLALVFAATARKNGASFHVYHQVTSLIIDGQRNVCGVKVINRTTGKELEMKGDIVVNATGAWAGEIASMAQATVPVKPTPGVMVAYDQRVTERVINRMNEPSDGDIIIPQRRMAVIGTTSFEVKDVDYIPVLKEQIQQMNDAAYELVPKLKQAHLRGAYMSARPLIGSSIQGRSLSRTFKCYDHQESDGLGGFVTITGGKATTCRGMAEKTADLVCQKLGISAACQTRDVVLRPYREYYHNQGGAA